MQSNTFQYEDSTLTLNVIREDILEHRLDDAFQFDRSSSLVSKEVNMTIIPTMLIIILT